MRTPVRKPVETPKPARRPLPKPEDVTPLTPFQKALQEVCGMAMGGSSPKSCAVVYRSLAKEYPHHNWLESYAYQWEQLGDSWMGPNAPKPGNLGAKRMSGMTFTEDDVEEAERQIERARLAGWLEDK